MKITVNSTVDSSRGLQGIILLLVLFTVIFATIPGLAKERTRVSVLDFSGNISDSLKLASTNKLTKVLVDLGRFEIVERAEIDKILEEQHLQMTGLIDQSRAVEIGKLLAIDVAFIGTVEYLTTTYNSQYRVYNAEARISVKIIDVQSGKIIHMIEASGYESDPVRDNAQLKALEDCFSMFFIGEIREAFAISTSVLRIRDKIIYFLNGDDIGVKTGSRFTVYRPDNNDLKDLGLGDNDVFKRKIGVVEVVEITQNLAKAKVVWNSEPISEGDFLTEVSMVVRPTLGLGFTITGLEIMDSNDRSYIGSVYALEGRVGVEKPLVKNTNLQGSFLHIGDNDPNNQTTSGVTIINVGAELQRELPIFRGRLNVIAAGGLGLSFGFQDYYDSYYRYTGEAIGISMYGSGFAGLKYYLSHDRGISFEFGMNGQFGPFFSKWNDNIEDGLGDDVTANVEYPKIKISGFGLRFGVNIPINMDQIF